MRDKRELAGAAGWLAEPSAGPAERRTYAHHKGDAVESSNGSDGEESHEQSHVKASAGSLLEHGAGVGLKHIVHQGLATRSQTGHLGWETHLELLLLGVDGVGACTVEWDGMLVDSDWFGWVGEERRVSARKRRESRHTVHKGVPE